MARKPKEVKPLVDVMHDYAAALKAVQDAATMLHNTAKFIATKDTGLEKVFKDDLLRAVNEYQIAMYGDVS